MKNDGFLSPPICHGPKAFVNFGRLTENCVTQRGLLQQPITDRVTRVTEALFLTVLEPAKSKVKEPADSVSGEHIPPSWLADGDVLLSPHVVEREGEGERGKAVSLLLPRALIPSWGRHAHNHQNPIICPRLCLCTWH